MIDFHFDPATWSAIKVIGGFVAGFAVSRLTMSKAERKAHQQRLYENGKEHRKARDERSHDFQAALKAYILKVEPADLEDFHSISRAGELYFGELRMIADAILGKKIDDQVRDNTFVPDIVEALQKTIPAYYEELRRVADKIGVPFSGEFRRENYQSLVEVAEKFGRMRVPKSSW